MTGSVSGKAYSPEEVREILRRAVERDASSRSGGVSGDLRRDALISAAEEMGMDASAVDAAIAEFEADRVVETEMRAIKDERRQGLRASFGTWAVVNTGLLALDTWDWPPNWFFYPLIGWGMALFLRHRRALFPQTARDRAEALVRIEKREREAARKRAVEQRRAAGWKLEGTIEQGVDALLTGVAQRLADAASQRWGASPPRPPAPRPPDPTAGRWEESHSDNEDQPEPTGSERQRPRRQRL
jgi:hypothetical protein